MDKSHKKARATRERNTEARTRLWEEQRAAISTARVGLRRVLESPDATPEQILEAAKLLTEITK